MIGGALPGGSPGPNARITTRGRWFLVIMGLVLAVLVFLAMKYCFDYAERSKDNPAPKPRSEPVHHPTNVEETKREMERMIKQESKKGDNGESRAK